ncbi:MAG TPA: patatin-like phospholipase family protein [Vicinamibacteria bacterium]|nr:patatin-like phospholipase family protein [Vicinamibacteria bacterium]
MDSSTGRRSIGLALGSGSARGWSHIGVIRVLERAGVSPDVVCGTSIGALVGAAYAAGELDRLESWIRTLTRQAVVGFLDVRFGGGLITGARLFDHIRAGFTDPGITGLGKTYGAVATELATGREVWLRDGPVLDAVRASIAVPGLFTPARQAGRLLVDGGLVNPVPVSLCRALGADTVIAVDLNGNLPERRRREATRSADVPTRVAALVAKVRTERRPRASKPEALSPSMMDVLTTSLSIMQVSITRSRLAGEPAEVVIRPCLSDFALMDFHRAAEAIAEGQRAAEQAMPEISERLALQSLPTAQETVPGD